MKKPYRSTLGICLSILKVLNEDTRDGGTIISVISRRGNLAHWTAKDYLKMLVVSGHIFTDDEAAWKITQKGRDAIHRLETIRDEFNLGEFIS